jgi:hypothetical protein
MLPAQLLSVLHYPLSVPSSYPPFAKSREGWGTRFCGGFCSLKEGPAARSAFGFRNGPALRYVQTSRRVARLSRWDSNSDRLLREIYYNHSRK